MTTTILKVSSLNAGDHAPAPRSAFASVTRPMSFDHVRVVDLPGPLGGPYAGI